MLKDIFFYPLAAIVIATLIFGALSLGDYEVLSPEDIRVKGFTVDGKDLATLTAAPGTNFEYIAETLDNPAYARLVTTLARDVAPPSQGIFAVLSSNYEEAFLGQRLRITISARASRQNGLSDFDMAYFTARSGWTGWKRKALTIDWADYVVDFKPKTAKPQGELNYLSIWPGVTSEPLTMDVQRMHIEIVDTP